MTHQEVKSDFKPLLVSFFISAAALMAGFFLIEELNAGTLEFVGDRLCAAS